MGFFDILFNTNSNRNNTNRKNTTTNINTNTNKPDNINPKNDNQPRINEIILSESSRIVSDYEYGDNDREYTISFKINDAFKEANSHAGEIVMLYTYSPNEEYGCEGSIPYVATILDDKVYHAVEQFKKNGNFEGAIDLVPLNGKFYFKAKMKYSNEMMCFYGLDRCDGSWENNGVCIVYQNEFVGTENEKKLMAVLDEVAESYSEILKG